MSYVKSTEYSSTGTPYAIGFTTLNREVNSMALPVEGSLPDWLGGTLIRTAPCKFEVGDKSYTHWFDGLAMLHAFAFADGKVSYSNRFVHSCSYREAMEKGRIARGEFMTDPCRALFGRVMSIFRPRPTDNPNVNVSILGGKLVALTESTMPIVFDHETLATLGHLEYPPSVKGQVSTAHPHYDGKRGYNYMIRMGRRSLYRLFIDENGTQRTLAEIPVERPAYMHSFGMSERYLILTEFPLRVNPLRLALSFQPFIRNYHWEPSLGTHLTVVDKSDGTIRARVRAPACFAFHHVNSFERDGSLFVDVLVYSDAGIIDELQLARLRAGPPVQSFATLTRFEIPLDKASASEVIPIEARALSPLRMELPRIDYSRRAGREYRYLWGAGQTRTGTFLDSIVRMEISDSGETSVMTWHKPGLYPGEPVFVPEPNGTREDEGVLLSVVLDTQNQRSFLLVLDASTLTERARATVPHHIPFGFHGNYFS